MTLNSFCIKISLALALLVLNHSDSRASQRFEKVIEFGFYTIGQRIISLPDSGYLIVGFSMDVFESALAIRLDKNGDTLWTRGFGNEHYSLDAVMTEDSGFLMVGSVADPSIDRSCLWKISHDGNLQWSKRISSDTVSNSFFTSIEKIGDNYFLGGVIDNEFVSGTGGDSPMLMKIDSSGNVIWSRMYYREFESYGVLSMKLTSDYNIIMTGVADSTYALKIDTLGNIIWAKTYSEGFFSSVAETADHGFVFSGFDFNSDCVLTKTDSGGNLVWMKAYADVTDPFSVIAGADGTILTAVTYFSGAGSHAAILKTDSAGVPLHLSAYFPLPTADDAGADIQATYDSGFVFLYQKDDGNGDMMVALAFMDSLLSSGCEFSVPLPQYMPISLQGSPLNFQIYTSYSSSGTTMPVYSGVYQAFNCAGPHVEELENFSIKVYPTISEGLINFSADKEIQLVIYNSAGQFVKSGDFKGEKTIDLTDLSDGIYFYRATSGEQKQISGKFVIQKSY